MLGAIDKYVLISESKTIFRDWIRVKCNKISNATEAVIWHGLFLGQNI